MAEIKISQRYKTTGKIEFSDILTYKILTVEERSHMADVSFSISVYYGIPGSSKWYIIK
jgi:hypothetical protein